VANFNLFLALGWLVFGAWLLVMEYAGNSPAGRIPGTNVSVAWFVLALFVYNLARWYSTRVAAQRRAVEAELAWQRRLEARSQERRDLPPDPNFQFTDEPPRPGPITRQPPPEG